MPSRSLRVSALVAAILALSLVDLILTLTYIMEIGMIEDNPIARVIISTGGPALLIAWKILTVGFASTVLLLARKRHITEVAAIFGMLVMVWLTIHWVQYIEASAKLTCATQEMDRLGQGHWVSAADTDLSGT